MDVLTLIDRLRKAGIQLHTSGDDLKVKAPPGALDATLVAQLKLHKTALLEMLRRTGTGHDEQEQIPAAPPQADYPLSAAQQSIWALCQDETASVAYNMPVTIQLPEVAAPSLALALNDLAARHEVLRTAFVAQPDGQVRQQVTTATIALHEEKVAETELRERIYEESMAAFDLSSAPLLRATLFNGELLVLTVHHIVCDGLSLDILQQELLAAYGSRKAGKAPQWPPLPLTYKDYAVWQEQALSSGWWEKETQYWKSVLQQEWELLDLNADVRRPAIKSFNGRHLAFTFPATLREEALRYCRQYRLSPFPVLLSALRTLFCRYTGKTDFILGTVTGGRVQESLQTIAGLFVNTLPLRLQLQPEDSFLQVSRRQQEALHQALAHQQLPFAHIAALANRKTDLSRSPVFDIMVIYNDHTHEDAQVPQQYDFLKEDVRHTSQFDLTFSFEATAAEWKLNIEFNTDIFEAAFVDRFWHQLCQLLQSAVAAPGQPVSVVPFLTASERALLDRFNDTGRDYPLNTTVIALIRETAMHYGDATAIICEDRRWSYTALWSAVRALSAYLVTCHGAGPGKIVAVRLERSEWLPIALLAIWHCGAAYVPLDLAYPEERSRYMLEDCACDILLTEEWLAHYRSLDYPHTDDEVMPAATPDALAYVIYTSGSTGKPKGVMIMQHNVTAFIHWALEEFRASAFETVYAVTSHCFDLSVFEFFFTLAAGKIIRMLPSGLHITDAVREDREVLLNTVPSVIQRLLEQPAFPWEHITVLNMAGEAVPQHFRDAFVHRPMEVRNLYGPSETTTYSTCYCFMAGEPITIGRPVANTQVYVLDANRQMVPVGVNGEIYIGGAGVTAGYLNKATLTEERYLPDPFRPGHYLFKTGDAGRWTANGQLIYGGRLDHQVKLRGFRIEAGEIECALENIAGVEKAVVMVKNAANRGDRLVAYLKGSDLPDRAVIAARLKAFLPVYMLPDVYVFMEAFPLTPNGKIDRAQLPFDEGMQVQPERTLVSPRNPVETLLHGLWTMVLGEGTPISVEDNFFEIGGNSLHAARLYALLKQHTGLKQGIRFVLEHATIAAQAALLEAGAPASPDIIPVAPVQETYPLSSFQERVWVLSKTAAGSMAYHIPGGMYIDGALNLPALTKAFKLLIARHDLLRTAFREDAYGVAFQQVRAADDVTPELTVARVTEDMPLDAYIRQNAAAPFQLGDGLPVRATLVQLGEQRYCLLYCLHHLVCDGWSLKLLENEWMQLYGRLLENPDARLPPLDIQYKDYLHWAAGQDDSADAQYWQQQLEGPLPVTQLPSDRQRPQEKSFRGSHSTVQITGDVAGRMRALCLQHHTTLFTGLMASLKILLSRYSGQQDMIIGIVTAGRQQAQLQQQIGPYLNTLPLRSRISGEFHFNTLLSHMHQQLLDAYEHQQYPFAKMLDLAEVAYEPGSSPLFDIMAVFQNQEQAGIGADIKAFSAQTTLTVKPLQENRLDASQMDLFFIFSETQEGVELCLEYSTDLYDASFIESLLQNYLTLLHEITADPGLPVNRYRSISQQQKQWLLHEVHGTDSARLPQSVVRVFEAQVALYPEAVAVVAGELQLTYTELNAFANRFAAYCSRVFMVRPQQRVGIQLPRSPWLAVAMLGVLKTGAAYVPVDMTYPEERVQHMLGDSDCSLLVTTGVVEDFLKECGLFPADNPPLAAGPEDTCYIIYTSGSTGVPKGVEVRHANVVTVVKDTNYVQITPDDVLLQWSNFAFDGAVFDMMGALLNGARLVMLQENEVADPVRLRYRIHEHGVTVMLITTALFNVMVDNDVTTFAPVRRLLFGGEQVSGRHVKKLLDYMGPGRLVHMYGPTETTVYATYHEVNHISPADVTVPIGMPLRDYQAYVLDASQQLLPKGAVGEICIGGAGVSAGYLNDPVRTAEKFIPHPFHKGMRLYRTGDLGRWQENGALAFAGRIDHQVKIRGHRIELPEIEHHLRQCEGVRDVIVVVHNAASDEKYLCAYIAGSIPEEAALRSHLLRMLPAYMVPSCFVVMEQLPLTPNGKVDRKALPQPVLQQEEKTFTTPVNDVQQQLWDLWKKVLGHEAFGITTGFSEAGGHSLKAGRLLAEIRKQLHTELLIPELLHTSIEEQAIAVGKATKGIQTAITPAPAAESYPLSEQQLGLFAADLLQQKGLDFLMDGGVCLRGPLQADYLKAAVDQLLQQHVILRTVYYTNGDGEARQWISENITIADVWQYRDVSEEKDPLSAVAAVAEEIALMPFALQRGPLFRIALLKCAADEHVLLYFAHHIVSDGWGLEVLRTSLLQAYSRIMQQQPVTPEAIQYRDYAVWQQKELAGASLQRYQQFWRAQFRSAPELIDLDIDTNDKDEADGIVTHPMEQPLLQKIHRLSQRMGASHFSIVMAAVNALLFTYSRMTDITLGTPFAGRLHADLDNVIGCFVNNLLIRNRFTPAHTLEKLLEEVTAVVSSTYQYQLFPTTMLNDLLHQLHGIEITDLNRFSVNYLNIDVRNKQAEQDLLNSTGLEISEAPHHDNVRSKYDVNFIFHETPEQLLLHIEFNGKRFGRQFAREAGERLTGILQCMVSEPALTLEALSQRYQSFSLDSLNEMATGDMDEWL